MRADLSRGWWELEDAWVRAGGAGLSAWWREWAESWGERRCEVVRVGRRGGKSSMIARLAVSELLWGEHDVPAGDTGVVAIVSVDRREAAGRLRTIAAMLDALGVTDGRRDRADDITVRGRAVRVFTASVGGVSGFTSIAALGDEVCKWRDTDGVANARDVISSLRPTMATQRNAVMGLFSSPWIAGDAHADLFERGDTDGQRVAWAPTWVANPSIGDCPVCAAKHGTMCEHETERRAVARAMTRRDEPDEVEWRREYEAVPMQGDAETMFGEDAIQGALC